MVFVRTALRPFFLLFWLLSLQHSVYTISKEEKKKVSNWVKTVSIFIRLPQNFPNIILKWKKKTYANFYVIIIVARNETAKSILCFRKRFFFCSLYKETLLVFFFSHWRKRFGSRMLSADVGYFFVISKTRKRNGFDIFFPFVSVYQK